ncbi:MAG: hypothetical protein KDE66_11290 [Nitrosomonas sp.]|nr:hypothetical protein [Nitrosomonas sp.]MCP5252433.1 hypothetical protein [Burkholderiales bacterium]MCP5292169.1 hypothetical protein [Burkholderiales bacterium]HQU61711.1 hypothetical protein [Nitrosomonas sp.]
MKIRIWKHAEYLQNDSINKLLKNVIETADCLAKTGDASKAQRTAMKLVLRAAALAPSKKQRLYVINEHFEPVFNAAAATKIFFQRPIKKEVLLSDRR